MVFVSLEVSHTSKTERSMTPEEIPDIHGAKWASRIIPDVVETLSKNPTLSRKEQRLLLEERFLKSYVRRTRVGWANIEGELLKNRRGEVLKTEDEVRHHLFWTWIDQYALPMCKTLMIIISTKNNFALTSQGKRLAESLGKPEFQDMLRHIVINLDREKWGILEALRKSPLGFDTLRDEVERSGVHVRKNEHLRKLMSLYEGLGLIKEKPRSTYELDQTRYERSMGVLRYRSCDDVDYLEYVTHLYQEWDKQQCLAHSSFVDIDALRSLVSRSLNISESCFNEKLKTIPLRIGDYQLLFSQASFPTENAGVERNGRYYSYISIYLRKAKIIN
jgi:hypothetical protein